ncbi:unnamed protein product [Meganyctiphanes norvegica]|uniref:Uncharacterized protein n=1 Tax=Meganyctiphanes norvegica TaxID=48144 RepID=A0AAV2S1C2_MEGNR
MSLGVSVRSISGSRVHLLLLPVLLRWVVPSIRISLGGGCILGGFRFESSSQIVWFHSRSKLMTVILSLVYKNKFELSSESIFYTQDSITVRILPGKMFIYSHHSVFQTFLLPCSDCLLLLKGLYHSSGLLAMRMRSGSWRRVRVSSLPIVSCSAMCGTLFRGNLEHVPSRLQVISY